MVSKKSAASSASKRRQILASDPESGDESPTSVSDFGMLVSALQSKFNKKAKDQQVHFEAEMKNVVAKTVETLGHKVGEYEKHLSQQLDGLQSELGKISKEREQQVKNYEKQYETMRNSIEVCLKELARIDQEYNDKIRQFFKSMNDYRSKNGQQAETIKGITEEVMQENRKVSDDNGRKRRKNG